MKVQQNVIVAPELTRQLQTIGHRMARLRMARHLKQTDAALRAGLSRTTAYRIEKGDPSLAVGQLLRYLDAISPGSTLAGLLLNDEPALMTLQAREETKRVRGLSKTERSAIDF